MYVFPANKFTDDNFTSPIPEPDASLGEIEWSAYTSAIGDERILTTTHRRYRAAVASTDSPDVGVKKDPKTWVDIGSTNRWAMLDNKNITQTVSDGSFTFYIIPGSVISNIAGFNITGVQVVNITVTAPSEGVIWEKSISMVDNTEVIDYWTWCFLPLKTRTEFVVNGLPFYSTITISIEFVGGGTVGVGSLPFGSSIHLGDINYGTSFKMIVGGIEEDSATLKMIDYKFTTLKNSAGLLYRQIEGLVLKPAVYFASENVDDGSMIFGIYDDSNISIDTPSFCPVSLSVRGVANVSASN